MEVSVRELKANLSRYLKLIEEGKSLEVTKYRRRVARIVPVKDTSKDSENKKIAKLLKSGMVTWSGKKPSGGRIRPVIKGKTVSEIVLEERG